MKVVVNDLSVKFPMESKYKANEIMENFINTYYSSSIQGISGIIYDKFFLALSYFGRRISNS